jgi:hypothetical protein
VRACAGLGNLEAAGFSSGGVLVAQALTLPAERPEAQ